MKTLLAKNALKPEREGVLAVLNDQTTTDRIRGSSTSCNWMTNSP